MLQDSGSARRGSLGRRSCAGASGRYNERVRSATHACCHAAVQGGRVPRFEPDSQDGDEQALDIRHRVAFDAVQDVILIMDAQGALLDANRAAEDVYGYQRDELLSLNIRDLRADHSVHDFNRQFRTAGEGGITFETIHARNDGSTLPVEVRSSPYPTADSDGVISVIRDVSFRREEEELRARLLAEVSDSNARLGSALTLLSSVVGAADLPSLLESTVSALSLVMKADAAIFVVQDGDSMRVSAEAGSSGWAPVGTRLEPGQGFCGRVAEAGAPLYVADILSSSAVRPGHRRAGVHSMFGVPVYVENELFGVLECAWVAERPVDDAESAMVKLAADRIALAIASARVLEQLPPWRAPECGTERSQHAPERLVRVGQGVGRRSRTRVFGPRVRHGPSGTCGSRRLAGRARLRARTALRRPGLRPARARCHVLGCPCGVRVQGEPARGMARHRALASARRWSHRCPHTEAWVGHCCSDGRARMDGLTSSRPTSSNGWPSR